MGIAFDHAEFLEIAGIRGPDYKQLGDNMLRSFRLGASSGKERK